jgi:hypothetical protein
VMSCHSGERWRFTWNRIFPRRSCGWPAPPPSRGRLSRSHRQWLAGLASSTRSRRRRRSPARPL